MELNTNLLNSLMAAIRLANPSQLDSLVRLVKSHLSPTELQSYLHTNFGREMLQADPESAVSSSEQLPRRRMLGRIEDIVNSLLQVPAKPWTTVTDDDDYVSHLMSLWFTWAHQWWCWVEKDVFLEAMTAKNVDSHVCASYLVNMILADACVSAYVLKASSKSLNSQATRYSGRRRDWSE
jgi:hypothetical protein